MDEHAKAKYLVRMLEEQSEAGLTLCFVETKKRADELESARGGSGAQGMELDRAGLSGGSDAQRHP